MGAGSPGPLSPASAGARCPGLPGWGEAAARFPRAGQRGRPYGGGRFLIGSERAER